ncbi:MAG TPA: flagellar biosynthesis protein FlhF [Deltaproteobacteria bacterium]|nr:flagellar biosynthesis protein FlhF [Deltaproteobacteria bacterium]HQH99736.1 flagellar biosynthesis protein FlhF [Deltaproteobacteria bacterium]HQJ08066.1 flagellar biosynthesis protein FlhF [Deltaproteobacteria bacterium]
MQIKTYTAASMKDILSRIKNELGSDAVILSKRELRDQNFGLSAKPLIEVTAAVDYDSAMYDRQAHITAVPSDSLPKTAVPLGNLSDDIIELKEMMKELITHTGLDVRQSNPIRKKLIASGIRQNLADIVLSKLGKQAKAESVRDLLSKIVQAAPPEQNKVWVFVGTTGVGKTTTIAKIAARCVLNENKRVGLITLDTYRIGAVDQGRIYAKILNIPFLSVTAASEFRAALAKLDSLDLILVDTVGRSPKCKDYIPRLKEYFDRVDPCTFLLMPVATRDSEMDTTTKAFAELGVDRMIFTKVDEAVASGPVISHNLIYRIPISHLTTGQRVPEDIEEASSHAIVERCLGDMR